MNSDALQQWVATQTGRPAIWSHPDAPRPERPYSTLQIISVQRVGDAVAAPVDAQGMRQVSGDREAVVSITVYADAVNRDPRAALDMATALRDSLDLVTARHTLKQGGWAVRGFELLTDAPQLLETQWEPRAVFDVRFGTTVDQLEDVGLIESIEVTGRVRDTDYTTTITAEV